MNLKKLKLAEDAFMNRYPGGFNHPDMLAIGKKHQMTKRVEQTQDAFAKKQFSSSETLLDDLRKTVTRSSMVSVFEKPKFRDFLLELSLPEQDRLLGALKAILHGNMQKGFETYASILKDGKLAKWSLMTVVPAYYRPTEEVFVKPTTAKGVIEHFELENLVYKPGPTWDFYEEYRRQINEMKRHVSSELSPSNAAFSGFLMMGMGAWGN